MGDKPKSESRPVSPTVHFWTKENDLILCQEVLLVNPFAARKKSIDRGKLWDEVKDNINNAAESKPNFTVTKRGVRDHLMNLIKNFKKKMTEEENASGISPEPTELDQALENIIEIEEQSEIEHEKNSKEKKEKVEADKQKAENTRQLAMEKLGETQKREKDDGEEKKVRKRRSRGDAVEYLREKSEADKVFKEEQLKLKQKKMDLDEKKHHDFLSQQSAILEQQKEMMQMMQLQQQQQQQQQSTTLAMVLQQQQQQTQAVMSLMDKIMKGK